MNGWVIDLMRESGEDMHVAWAEIEDGVVVECATLPLADSQGTLFTPDYLRQVFDTDAPADELMLGDWSGEPGDRQYIGGPVAAIMAANDATLIKRRIVAQ
jgi:hypothetical protein